MNFIEFSLIKCVLSSCLSTQFVCYFLLSYDGQRKRVLKKPVFLTTKVKASNVTERTVAMQ